MFTGLQRKGGNGKNETRAKANPPLDEKNHPAEVFRLAAVLGRRPADPRAQGRKERRRKMKTLAKADPGGKHRGGRNTGGK